MAGNGLFVVNELPRVCVDSLHEGTHTLGVHVRVHAVAQVCNVASGAKTLHHGLYYLRNALLNRKKTEVQKRFPRNHISRFA